MEQKELAVTLQRKPDLNFEHHYKGYKIHPSVCNVKVWKIGVKAFVLFTDMGQGTSVTNASEQLVTEVYNGHLKAEFQKEDCLFAETYGEKEGIDLVLPLWYGNECTNVRWKRLGVLVETTQV